ncbi:MAG: hypothetical protein ACRCX2_02255 [Paraclostridium sp.]
MEYENIRELKELNIYSEQELIEISSKIIHKLQFDTMDFCSCGRSDEISFMIRDVLRAIENKRLNWDTMKFEDYYEIFNKELIETIGFDSNHIVFEFILHVLNSAGLLEHGSGVGGSWLTGYGEDVLCAFEIVKDGILDVE